MTLSAKLVLLALSALFFLLAAFSVTANVKWEYLGWACFALSFAFA